MVVPKTRLLPPPVVISRVVPIVVVELVLAVVVARWLCQLLVVAVERMLAPAPVEAEQRLVVEP